MQRGVKLFEMPEIGKEGIFFTIKDVTHTPEVPKMNDPFTVKGKVQLFSLPFFAPVWVIVTVTYPEKWWEEIIPIIGAPEVRESSMVVGSDFEITFKRGFQREGEFDLSVRVYPGPTYPLDSLVFPPAPAFATEETTFIVAGEAPPQEELFADFRIVSYSKNSGPPVSPPGVLELEVGDRCRVNLAYNHKGPAVTGKFHAAIWHRGLIDPHDEILFKEQSFSVPSSTDWEPYEKSIDITITSAISPGSDYGLYCKIMGITGADVYTEFLENVITITGVPTEGEFRNFGITWSPDPAVLNYGDSLTVHHHFEYKGPRYTGADIRTAIGTRGIFGFDEILAKSVSLEAFGPDEDWRGYDVDVAIPITTAISPGTDYDLYSKLTDIPGADLYDYKDDIIEIVGAPPAGSITSKWINKAPEGNKIPLPTTVTADGNTFEIGVRGRNNSTVSFIAGMEVVVYDPDGIKRAAPAIDWAGISPDEELGWEYNICRVDKLGTWTAEITFLTKDGVELDRFEGACLEAVEEKYEGSITGKWINKAPEGSKIAIPTEVKADNHTFEVGVKYKNYSGRTITGGCKVEVRDPGGILRASPAVDWTGMSDNEELSKEYNICRVDKLGDWTIHIDFLIDSTVVDDYDGLLFTAVEEGVPPEAEFKNLKITSMTREAKIGETCHMNISFEYRGPIITKELYGAIGNVHHIPTTWFDEIITGSQYIEIPAAASWRTLTGSVDVPITSVIAPGTYDAYAKIVDPLTLSPYYGDALIVEEEVVAKYRLTTEVRPPGSGRVEKDPDKPEYDEDEEVTLWGEGPNPFDHWSGDAVGTWSPVTIAMNYNKHVVAWFSVAEKYTLDVRLSHAVGYVKVSPDKASYSPGEKVTLTAYLDPGQEAYWYLDHWTVNGVARAGNPITITMDENKVVVAKFIYIGPF